MPAGIGSRSRIGRQATPTLGAIDPRGLGGGSSGGFQSIIKQMTTQQDKANLLNEQRYKQALGQFDLLGKAGETRIQQQETRQQAQATQGLISRGLGSTTITESARRGIASDAETARQQLGEGIAVQKAGIMERRTDVGPDLGMFANLLQAAGQGGGGQQATITRMGAQAAAGRDVFGQPFKYGQGGGGGGGGGFSGGRAAGGGGGGGGSFGGGGAGGGTGGGAPPGFKLTLDGDATPAPPGAFEEDGVSGLIGQDIDQLAAGKKEETYEQYRKRVKMPVSQGYWAQFIKGRG